ncbi:hypothetical protein CAC42_544 [Sphaceloma murrayae]|uniref:mRNA-capping enzyme subunit beta n=1 Tax=Sphaceloma murrayae TaxID=2082308 RepID=A0A2K1R3S9_9PEZI|nr:hypothetical protein CAC42_544 [Sphaceloma murrayae]
MDIRALMNKDPAPSSEQSGRAPPSHPTPPSVSRSASGNFSTTPLHHQQQFQRPSVSAYPAQPPPIDTRASTFSSPGIANPQYTPVRTPQSQTPGSYPFPAQYQSPIQGHQRGPDRFPSLTPGGRSASHSYGQPHDQRSPSSFAAPAPPHPPPPPPLSASHSHTSATPPSASLHSPHAVRESPGPIQVLQQNPYGPTHHGSQPNTPLGPPSAHRQQVTTPREIISPYAPRQRTFSGTSASGPRSLASNSPGPPVSAINHITESPAGYAPTLSHLKRRSTEQVQQAERDRSASISPKTQVSRRQPSGDSRHPSHDAWSARSSINQGKMEGEMRMAGVEYPPPQYAHPQSSLSRSSTGHLSQGAPSPLSQTHGIPQQRHTSADHQARPPVIETSHISSSKPPAEDSSRQFLRTEENVSLLQQPVSQSMMAGSTPVKARASDSIETVTPLKRRADDMAQPEAKKLRAQYKEPPTWARLHPSNPGYEAQLRKFPQLKSAPMHDTRAPPKRQLQPVTPSQKPISQPPQSLPLGPQMNGQAPTLSASDSAGRKAEVSRKLNMPWEVSVTDTERANPLTTEICTFLFTQMLIRSSLGAGDPRNGSLEIEAKLGTLIDRQTDGRLSLPVKTTTVLKEEYSSRHLKFESMMDELENRNMNDYLNELTKASRGFIDLPGVPKRAPHEPPRVPIEYKHRYERDTFAILSAYGRQHLPQCAHEELQKPNRRNETIRIRTTYDNNPKVDKSQPPPIIAKIVKLRLADLDIYCPEHPFDIRLSVNIEIDFQGRTDVDHDLLSEPVEKKDTNPDRFKNRVSYKHLLYQIDLTQVTNDAAGKGSKTHELEVEVNAEELRRQAVELQQGRENAFEAVVEGLINNIMLLARHGMPGRKEA